MIVVVNEAIVGWYRYRCLSGNGIRSERMVRETQFKNRSEKTCYQERSFLPNNGLHPTRLSPSKIGEHTRFRGVL
jgi:hypothetical protein